VVVASKIKRIEQIAPFPARMTSDSRLHGNLCEAHAGPVAQINGNLVVNCGQVATEPPARR
jgi:hypothetical protein